MSPDYSQLQQTLRACSEKHMRTTDFSISHRGAPLQYPEHTKEGYLAAARMGAGVLECDVAFTKDKQLVCRHSHSDLQTTTNILTDVDLAKTCVIPFTPAFGEQKATAECRTNDITLAEFLTLKGKMDSMDGTAMTTDDFMGGIANYRTNLFSTYGTLMTHKDYINLAQALRLKMTPELKESAVPMPFDNYTQDNFRQALIDEYVQAGVKPSDVYAQSFNLEDIRYWIKNAPDFGKQAVYLVDQMNETIDSLDALKRLKAEGVNIIAPAFLRLFTEKDGEIVLSEFAHNLKKADLKVITWSLERGASLTAGGGYYYETTTGIPKQEGDIYQYLALLDAGVDLIGVFSDWPATVSYYANCAR